MQRGKGARPNGAMRPKNDGIHSGLEDLIPTGFAFPKPQPPSEKRPDSSRIGRPGTAGRGLGASGAHPNDLLGSISKLEKESEQRAMELIKLRTLILKLEAQREDALDTVKQCKKETADVKEELAKCQSEVAILRKEQVANRISGWLDTATGLSTVRAASYLPDSPLAVGERTKSHGMMAPPQLQPGQSPLSRGIGGSSMGGSRTRVSGPGYVSIDVPSRLPHNAPPPPPSPPNAPALANSSSEEQRADHFASTPGAVPSSNVIDANSSAQILQLQSELEQALIVQEQALADKASAEQKVAEALIEKELLEREKKERQDKEKKVVDSNRLLKEKEEALRRLQEVVVKLEEDKDHEVQMRQVEIQHLKDLHEEEVKRMKEENDALKAQYEELKNQAASSQHQKEEPSSEQLVAMEAEWQDKLTAAQIEAQSKIEELGKKVKEAEEALLVARSDSERYQKEIQILKDVAEAMAREVTQKEAQHVLELERSSAVAKGISKSMPQVKELEESLAAAKEELSSLHQQRDELKEKLKKLEPIEETVRSHELSLEVLQNEISSLKAERDEWIAKEKDMKDQLASLKPMILQAVAEAEAKGRKDADAAMKAARSDWDKEKKSELDQGAKASCDEIARLKLEAEEAVVKLKEAVMVSERHQKAADEALSRSKDLAEEIEVMRSKVKSLEVERGETEATTLKLKAELSELRQELAEASKAKEEATRKASLDAEAAAKSSGELVEAKKLLDSQAKLLEEKEAVLVGLQASESSLNEKHASALKELEEKVKDAEGKVKSTVEEKERWQSEAEASKAAARDAEEKAASHSSSIAETEKQLGDLLLRQREEMERKIDELSAEIVSLKASVAWSESKSLEAQAELKASVEKCESLQTELKVSEKRCESLQTELSSALGQKSAAELRASDSESHAKQLKEQLDTLTETISPSPRDTSEDSSFEKDDVDAMRDQGERMRVLIKTMAMQMESLQNNLLTQTGLVAKVQAALEEERAESEALAQLLQANRLKETELRSKLEEAERKLTAMRLRSHESSAPLVATRPSSAGWDNGSRQSILSARGANQSQRSIVKQSSSIKARSSLSGHDLSAALSKSVELPSIGK